MIDAANTAVFDPAKTKIGSAVGAVKIEKSSASLAIAKQNQIFAEQPHG